MKKLRVLPPAAGLALCVGMLAALWPATVVRADPVSFFQDAGDWFLGLFGADTGHHSSSIGGGGPQSPDGGAAPAPAPAPANEVAVLQPLPDGDGGFLPPDGDGDDIHPAVPEPGTALLALLGGLGLLAARRRAAR